MNFIKTTIAVLALGLAATSANAQSNVTIVGGEKMYPKKNIVENAVNSKDHVLLVTAVKAAGLVDVLMSEGPFTVFAPVDDAFENLPEGTLETVLKPENKSMLSAILTYHVVPGSVSSEELVAMITKGKGKATLTTVQGGKLMAMMNGNNVMIQDENGNTANIVVKDVKQSNGMIHVIDTVVLPN